MLVEDLCHGEPFMLHWGDILVTPSNYPAILAMFTGAPQPPTCVVGMNYVDDPYAGAAVYRENGRITALVEKPPKGTATTNWNNAGVLVLGPRVWPYVHQIPLSPRDEYEYTDALHMMIEGGEYLLGFELTGLWSDVGTPEIVAELNGKPELFV
jgi:dTDP-glucose pyrophosphorylase